MKITLIVAFLFLSVNAKAQADPQTIKEIEKVCNYYLEGGTNGDSVMFSKAFFPGGQMNYMNKDTLVTVALKDFMGRARNTGQKQNRQTKVENIQVFGNAAVAKLTIEYSHILFPRYHEPTKDKGWLEDRQ